MCATNALPLMALIQNFYFGFSLLSTGLKDFTQLLVYDLFAETTLISPFCISPPRTINGHILLLQGSYAGQKYFWVKILSIHVHVSDKQVSTPLL